MELIILSSNSDYVVLNKPINVGMDECVQFVKKNCGNDFLKPLYNLDKKIRGIVVFAKNEKALDNLETQFENGEMEMSYFCVTVGKPKVEKGFFGAFINKDKQTEKYTFIPQLNLGAESLNFAYFVESSVDKINLVKIDSKELNQEKLRFAMSAEGMPIFGDSTYGGDVLVKNTNLALELSCLRFKNLNNEYVSFRIEPCNKKPWSYFPKSEIFKL